MIIINNKRGKFLQELRKEKELSQEQLGELIHYSRNNVSKWERDISFPSDPNVLIKLSNILGVSVEELMYGERKNEKNTQLIIDNLVNNSLNTYKRIVKKNVTILVTSLIVIIMSMILIYLLFIKGSVAIYQLSIDDSEFLMNDSLLLLSNKKSVLNFNKIISRDKEINKITLYYEKMNGDIEIIFSSENDDLVIKEDNGYNEYGLSNIIENNTFVEIVLSDGVTRRVRVNVNKEYENTNIFPKKEREISTIPSIPYDNKNYDILIKNGFSLSDDEELYYRSIGNGIHVYVTCVSGVDGSIKVIDRTKENSKTIIESKIQEDVINILYFDEKIEKDSSTKDLSKISSKDCNKNSCSSIEDYVKYVAFLKRVLNDA